MRKTLVVLVTIPILWSFLFIQTAAATGPLSLSHTLSGVTEGTDTVTLDIALHVENRGGGDLSNVTLSYVPLYIFATRDVTVVVGELGVGASADMAFSLTMPTFQEPFDEAAFAGERLFWAGEGTDSSGLPVEFPAMSQRAVIDGGAL